MAATAGSAALAGFVAGLVGFAIPGTPSPAAAMLVLVTVAALDGALLAWGRPRPPSSRQQVPAAWSRVFPSPVVALLYGARLGVGPLTILPTWMWWGAFVFGAWLGPIDAVMVGLAFAGGRVIGVVGLGLWVQTQAPARMAFVRAGERRSAVGLLLLTCIAFVPWGLR